MEIFHFVADQLQNTPLFSSQIATATRVGAIFNDFDNENPFEAVNDSSTPSTQFESESTQHPETVSQADVDYALLEADKIDGIFYEHLTFDTVNFDITSEMADESYRQKVYNIITEDSDKLHMSEEIIRIFDMRERNNCSLADTVYDAWLLLNRRPRTWFPAELFSLEYPDWEKRVEESINNETSSQNDDNTDVDINDDSDFKYAKLLFSLKK